MRGEVPFQLVRTDDLDNLEQLVLIVAPAEEVFAAENLVSGRRQECMDVAATKRNGGCSGTHHRREDAADAPYVQAVVVVLVPDEELGALVVPRRDANVELRAWVVELGEAPVDQA